LEPGHRGPVVAVRGRSLMPYCHFELEDSDYIRSGRRNPDLPGPFGSSALDPNTRAIEFISTGIGIGCSVKFDVINPTNQNYSFAWKCKDEIDSKQLPAFVCHCSDGVISSGKKTQVSKYKVVYSWLKLEFVQNRLYSSFYIASQTVDEYYIKAKEMIISFESLHITDKVVLRKWRK